MIVKVTTTHEDHDNWFLEVTFEKETTVAGLLGRLAGKPYGLSVTERSKVLRRLLKNGVTTGFETLQAEKICPEEVVLHNFCPPASASQQKGLAQLGAQPAAAADVAAMHAMVDPAKRTTTTVMVRTTLENRHDWRVELLLPKTTTIAKLRTLLAKPPHKLAVKPETRVLMFRSDRMLALHDHEQIRDILWLEGFEPPESKPDANASAVAGAVKLAQRGATHQLLASSALEEPKYLDLAQKRYSQVGVEHLARQYSRFMSRAEAYTRSRCTTLTYLIAALQTRGHLRVGTPGRPLQIWYLTPEKAIDGEIIGRGFYESVNALDRAPIDIWFLDGQFPADTPVPNNGPPGPNIHFGEYQTMHLRKNNVPADLHIITKADMWYAGLQYCPQIFREYMILNSPPIAVISRETPGDAKVAEIEARHASKLLLNWTRCPFSALAGDRDADFDENGWVQVYKGLAEFDSVWKEFVDALAESGPCPRVAVPKSLDTPKITAQFWGIVDLKFDHTQPLGHRIKVLETGDGRNSRFSEEGASIPIVFRERFRMDASGGSGKHTVISANKKLTHDLFEKYGYGHLVPKQVCFPRVYTPGMGAEILKGLDIKNPTDLVILKLCNRSRGAGVMPCEAGKLEESLKWYLPPISKELADDWLQKQAEPSLLLAKLELIETDEEQRRHWWSNECPYFVAEEYCKSAPISPPDKADRLFDATMRVAFTVYKKKGAQSGGQDAFNFLVQEMNNKAGHKASSEEDLQLAWLGGYWKLPQDDQSSMDVRKKTISAARTAGTMKVERAFLAEIFSALHDPLLKLYGGAEPTQAMFAETYSDKRELEAYLYARLGIAMKDATRMTTALNVATKKLARAPDGLARETAESFLRRCLGVIEVFKEEPDFMKARRFFSESNRYHPANATSYYLQGMCELELGHPDAAAYCLFRALALDPDFKAPYVNLAVALLRRKAYDYAIYFSLMGIRRHPDTPQLEYNVGLAMYYSALAIQDKMEENERRMEFNSIIHGARKSLLKAREHYHAKKAESITGPRPGPAPFSDFDTAVLAALESADVMSRPLDEAEGGPSAAGEVSLDPLEGLYRTFVQDQKRHQDRLSEVNSAPLYLASVEPPADIGWYYFGFRN